MRLYLVYRSWGVKRIFWTTVMEFDWPEEFGAKLGTPGNPHHYFSLIGLVHNGKGDGDPGRGVRKLAFHTYRLLVERLGNADWDDLDLMRDDDEVVVFRLRSNGKSAYVVWRPKDKSPRPRLEPVSVELDIEGKAATVTSLVPDAKEGKDILGDRALFAFRRVEAIGGRVTLTPTEEPVLVEAE